MIDQLDLKKKMTNQSFNSVGSSSGSTQTTSNTNLTSTTTTTTPSILDSISSNTYIFDCIHINNDVKEYRITRKSKTIIYPFDYTLFIIISLHTLYLLSKSYFPLKSFMYDLLLVVMIVRLFLKLFIVREESLTVIRELGVQKRKKFYFGSFETKKFIEKTKIQSIIINEGISRYRVTFYMAFIVEGKQKMILAFDDLIPRINVLLKIYRGTRALVYGESEE